MLMSSFWESTQCLSVIMENKLHAFPSMYSNNVFKAQVKVVA